MKNEGNAENTTEKYSKREVFACLFPGNKFEDLPAVNGSVELSVFVKTYIDADGSRKVHFAKSEVDGKEYASRENVPFDQLTAGYFLRDLIPLETVTHPSFFRGNSFVDLVDTSKGEKLGGASERPVSWYRFPVTNLALHWGGTIRIWKSRKLFWVFLIKTINQLP